jgi:hypothetical protein
MQLELDLLGVQQIPPAELYGFVDEDAGEGFRLARRRSSSSVSYVAKKNTSSHAGKHPVLGSVRRER